MNKLKLKSLAAVALFSIAFAACGGKDDPEPTDPTETTAKVGFTIKNVAGMDPVLSPGVNQYSNPSNELFTITLFKYYMSNFKLIRKDGTTFDIPESYHLVDAFNASTLHFHFEKIPFAEYKGVSFLIGVDKDRNTSGAQTGDLDPAKDMFWTWSTGYIMAKLEGTSSSVPTPDNKYRLHIGGFEGDNSALRTVTINFASNMMLVADTEGEIALKADVLEWFKPSDISLASTNNIMMPSTTSRKIADNYADMFSLTSMEVIPE
jgi:hypothetical protein